VVVVTEISGMWIPRPLHELILYVSRGMWIRLLDELVLPHVSDTWEVVVVIEIGMFLWCFPPSSSSWLCVVVLVVVVSVCDFFVGFGFCMFVGLVGKMNKLRTQGTTNLSHQSFMKKFSSFKFVKV